MAKQSNVALTPVLGELMDAPTIRSIDDISPLDLMSMQPVSEKPPRESRYPSTQKAFDALKAEAEDEEPGARAFGGDTDASAANIGKAADEADVDDERSEDGMPLALAGAPAPLAPTTLASFNGINATGWTPPDCTMAVGTQHVLVAVNVNIACYTKAGGLVFNLPIATFLGAGNVPAGSTIFDPKLAYDHYAGRYILVITAVKNSAPQGSWFIIATSNTNNPTGTWSVRTMNALIGATWADYPTLGFDSQAIYISSNQFTFAGSFSQSRIRILKKSQVYAAGGITWVDFNSLTNNDGSQAFTIQPCSHFHGGGNGVAYFVNAYWPTAAGASKLTLWKLSNPITTPTLTRVAVNVNNFKMPPNAIQPSGGALTTGDIRLLNAVYQFSGGVQRVWTAHTVRVQWAANDIRSAVRWYEIDVNTNTVVQQQDYGGAQLYYTYPVIQTDANRNAYMVFTVVGQTAFAQMRQTGRLAANPANTMQASALVKAGLSNQPAARWGDYFGIARDPVATTEVWGFGEFANAASQWGTWIARMKF